MTYLHILRVRRDPFDNGWLVEADEQGPFDSKAEALEKALAEEASLAHLTQVQMVYQLADLLGYRSADGCIDPTPEWLAQMVLAERLQADRVLESAFRSIEALTETLEAVDYSSRDE